MHCLQSRAFLVQRIIQVEKSKYLENQNSEKTWPCWRFSNGFKRIGRGKNYTGFREKYYKLIVYYSFMIVFFTWLNREMSVWLYIIWWLRKSLPFLMGYRQRYYCYKIQIRWISSLVSKILTILHLVSHTKRMATEELYRCTLVPFIL